MSDLLAVPRPVAAQAVEYSCVRRPCRCGVVLLRARLGLGCAGVGAVLCWGRAGRVCCFMCCARQACSHLLHAGGVALGICHGLCEAKHSVCVCACLIPQFFLFYICRTMHPYTASFDWARELRSIKCALSLRKRSYAYYKIVLWREWLYVLYYSFSTHGNFSTSMRTSGAFKALIIINSRAVGAT